MGEFHRELHRKGVTRELLWGAIGIPGSVGGTGFCELVNNTTFEAFPDNCGTDVLLKRVRSPKHRVKIETPVKIVEMLPPLRIAFSEDDDAGRGGAAGS